MCLYVFEILHTLALKSKKPMYIKCLMRMVMKFLSIFSVHGRDIAWVTPTIKTNITDSWVSYVNWNFRTVKDTFEINISYRGGNKYRKQIEPLKKVQHNKTENVAGTVWLNLFLDGSGNGKLPSTPSCTGLSRIQHLKMIIANFEF